MYVKELILFLLGVGLYNVFYANANGQQRVVRDLQIGVVVQFAVGIIGLLGASFYDRFLAFDQCSVTLHVFMVQSRNIAYITSPQPPFSN